MYMAPLKFTAGADREQYAWKVFCAGAGDGEKAAVFGARNSSTKPRLNDDPSGRPVFAPHYRQTREDGRTHHPKCNY